MNIIEGSIIDATDQYIVQQCCCIATKPHGLSKLIADKLGSDPYTKRRSLNGRNYAILEDQPKVGSIEVINRVICMFAQYGMGKCTKTISETYAKRFMWFKMCLEEVAKLKPTSLAFPYNIGCGLAGGDWDKYYPALQEFSIKYPDIKITLYKLV